MLFIIEFFRKKSTKISILILTIIFVILQIIFSFINYYSSIIDDIYSNNIYYSIKFDNDVYNTLTLNTNITEVKRYLPFYYNGEFINYLFDLDSENVVVLSNDNLESYECIIEISENLFNDDLKFGDTISFVYENKEINLSITDIVNGKYNRVFISDKLFNDLILEDSFYYIFEISKNQNAEKILDSLSNLDFFVGVEVFHSFINLDKINTELLYEDVLLILKKILIVICIVFAIVYLFVLKIILQKEREDMFIDKMLGYNPYYISLLVLIKVILLNIVCVLFSIIMSEFIIFILNLFGLNL